MTKQNVKALAWLISLASLLLAVIAWGGLYRWNLSGLSAYQIFPLFGLVAFSLMWSHYMAAVLRVRAGFDKQTLKKYFDQTSYAVFAALLLHPGLLIWQLSSDGAGWPPGSTLNYVAPGLRISLIAGIVAWLAFMAYEFRRKFSDHSWWKYVSYASDLAMLLVFAHGLNLGSHLQYGWFRTIWLFYGLSLVTALVYLHTRPKTR